MPMLEKSPLPSDDGRELGVTTMFYAVILPLYNQDNWPYLDQLFDEVARGQTQTAFLLADSYNERDPDGTYGSNSNEIGRANVCTPVTNEHFVCRILINKTKES